MRRETEELGFVELGRLIGACRRKNDITENDLYHGICGRAKGRRLEQGQNAIDEWQLQLILSRLHIQPYLCDCSLSGRQFGLRELRLEIERQLRAGNEDGVRQGLERYEQLAQERLNHSQRQYILWKEAQLEERRFLRRGCTAEPESRLSERFLEALSLSVSAQELEKRLTKTSAVAVEELEMYFGYRVHAHSLPLERCEQLLTFLEEKVLSADVAADCYVTVGQYAIGLLIGQTQETEAERLCRRLITTLKRYGIGFGLPGLFGLLAEFVRVRDAPEAEWLMQQAGYLRAALGEQENIQK